MLVLIGLLAPKSEMPLAQLADALGASIDQVASDLELLSLCGVAPYYPDDLVPLYVDGETVNVFGEMPALDLRVRLSAPEARALASALQAAGRAATDSLVARLLSAAGEPDHLALERLIRTFSQTDPSVHGSIALALDRSEVVAVRYQSSGAEEVTERLVEPLALLDDQGTWYVEAYCRLAEAIRLFRVDRIESVRPIGERFERRCVPVLRSAVPDGKMPLARIRFDAGVELPEREWPHMRVVETSATGTLVEVPYAGTGWISRQVLSFLGTAEVLEPAEVRDAVAQLAATEAARLGRRAPEDA
jgi:proteasome accessory factor C